MQAPVQPTTRRQLVAGIVVIILAIGVVVGLVAAFWWAVRRVDPSVTVAVIGAMATILVATLTIVGGRIFERRKSIEAQQRDKWAVIYEQFVSDWTHAMGLDQPPATRKPIPDKEMAKFMAHFSAQAMVWGSNRLITEWGTWKKISGTPDDGTQGLRLLFQFEKIMLAMRTDLGHKNTSNQHDLLRMFISDFDESGLANLRPIARGDQTSASS